MSRHPDVTVVGSINQDMVARVPRLPGPGQTVLGRELFDRAGWEGAEPGSVAAARSGTRHGLRRHGGPGRRATHLPAVPRTRASTSHGVLRGCARRGRSSQWRTAARTTSSSCPARPGRRPGRCIDHHRARIATPPGAVLARLEIPMGCGRGSVAAAGQGGRRPHHPQRHAAGASWRPALIRAIRLPGRERGTRRRRWTEMAVSTPADAAAAGAAPRAQG